MCVLFVLKYSVQKFEESRDFDAEHGTVPIPSSNANDPRKPQNLPRLLPRTPNTRFF